MKFGLGLFCFLVVVSVPNLRGQDVAVNFDNSTDFSRFKTYSWTSGVPAKNPLVDTQIKTSIEEQLAAKGLRRVDQGGDLSVLYLVALDRDLEVSTSRWETKNDWTNQSTSGVSIRNQVWDVEVGTLVVCLSDASGRNLLWRGTARTALDKRSTNDNPMEAMAEDARRVEKKIKKSVGKMFKQYPVVKSAG